MVDTVVIMVNVVQHKVREVASILNASRQQVLNLINRGEFPNAFRVGQDYRVPAPDVASYLERHRVGSTPAPTTSSP